ncbi:MAG: DNA polymerase III subunit delta [Gammaproteobacteria bacterium]
MRLTAEQLPNQLNKGLVPFYWVSGEETLLVQETAQAIRTAATQAGFSERRILETDSGFDWQQFALYTHNLSLFSQRCLLELCLPSPSFNDAAKTALTRYVEHPPADKILLLITPKLDSKQLQSQWFKRLESNSAIVLIKPLERQQWSRWLAQRLRQAGLNADASGLEWLTACYEGNLIAAVQAIEKLELIHGANPIGVAEIAATLEDNSRFEVFDLLDPALAGEATKTWHILQRLKQTHAEPVLILWALTREIRLLLAIAHASEQRLSIEALLTQHRVWEKRKMLLKTAAQRHSSRQLSLLLQQAAYLDRIIKGALPGNIWQGLTTLTLCLAGVAQLSQFSDHHYDRV